MPRDLRASMPQSPWRNKRSFNSCNLDNLTIIDDPTPQPSCVTLHLASSSSLGEALEERDVVVKERRKEGAC